MDSERSASTSPERWRQRLFSDWGTLRKPQVEVGILRSFAYVLGRNGPEASLDLGHDSLPRIRLILEAKISSTQPRVFNKQ